MRIQSFVLIAVLGFSLEVRAQATAALNTSVRVDVVYLASDALEGRESGSPGATLAADYIAKRFRELGLQPKGTSGYFQDFEFETIANPHDSTSSEKRGGRNVMGLLDRGGEYTIIVGAHYDHLGYGGAGSRAPGVSEIHNGADDNASGVAGMLEIARQLVANPPHSDNVLFIAFAGEEFGLFGSKYFVNHPTLDLSKVNYMINLDMVGRLRESLIVAGAGTSPSWIPLLDSMHPDGFAIKTDSSGLGPSDHASFYLHDIPVLHLFTGQHPDYHKPSDDSPLINFDGITTVASFATAVIDSLDNPEPLAFQKTRDRSPQRAAAFKVSLGVMPDYSFSGTGLRIDAVLDDRPAAAAGLQAGDVVIELGDMPIKDIYSYMEALAKFSSGDKASIVVKRGEDEVSSEVVF